MSRSRAESYANDSTSVDVTDGAADDDDVRVRWKRAVSGPTAISQKQKSTLPPSNGRSSPEGERVAGGRTCGLRGGIAIAAFETTPTFAAEDQVLVSFDRI